MTEKKTPTVSDELVKLLVPVMFLVADGCHHMSINQPFLTGFIKLAPSFRIDVQVVLLGLCAGIAVTLLGLGLKYLVNKAGLELGDTDYSYSNWTDILKVAALTGLAEELLCRGIIQSWCGLWFASVFFGLAHCKDVKSCPYALCTGIMGLFLGYVYLQCGNLWVPIIAHALFNFAKGLRYHLQQNKIAASTAVA